MIHTIRRHASRTAIVLLALSLGVAGVRSLPRTDARAATGLSPLDRLIAEDDIRQRLALYALYADGDGVSPIDTAALAQQLMTPDVVSKSYPANGGPPRVLLGRGPVAATAPRALPAANRPVAKRHFLVQTYFDEITPTTARTRTTAIFFRVTRNLSIGDCKKAGPDACGGKVVSSVIWVYHMTWRKTSEGWQISQDILRDDT